MSKMLNRYGSEVLRSVDQVIERDLDNDNRKLTTKIDPHPWVDGEARRVFLKFQTNPANPLHLK